MRFATIVENGRSSVAVVEAERLLPLAIDDVQLDSIRGIAASGEAGLQLVRDWVARQPGDAYRAIEGVEFGPAVPYPGAIYTIGLNYSVPGETADARPPRPLVYGKLPMAVAAHGAVLTWDRVLTANVDAECELGVVIGSHAFEVTLDDAMSHVFGYTIVNDVSSRDSWLDGDQWLLGKSMAGFCPVGPCIVTRDELAPDNLRLGCTLNGAAIQDGSTAQMRYSIAEIISYLSRHTVLRPGDLIATGTLARLAAAPGPDRHLEPGDVVSVWIEHIGELTTTIA